MKQPGEKLGISIRGGARGHAGNPFDPTDEGIFISKVPTMMRDSLTRWLYSSYLTDYKNKHRGPTNCLIFIRFLFLFPFFIYSTVLFLR